MPLVSQSELIAGARLGKAVSFPTDTVPALAIKPEYGAHIYQLKQRPNQKPLILMGASLAELLPFVAYTDEQLQAWQQSIAQHWPGALTLVLPASELVPDVINSTSSNTIGIRVPDNSVALEILKQTGVLATTSANISGRDALRDLKAIAETFTDVLVLDDRHLAEKDRIGSGNPSTVACWQSGQWQVLRQGSVNLHVDRNSLRNLC